MLARFPSITLTSVAMASTCCGPSAPHDAKNVASGCGNSAASSCKPRPLNIALSQCSDLNSALKGEGGASACAAARFAGDEKDGNDDDDDDDDNDDDEDDGDDCVPT